MKKNTLFIIAFLCYSLGFTQSFNYQSVIRDASNIPLENQSIGVQVKILEGSSTGTTAYTETHTVASNAFGVISISIGEGTSSDTFSSIDWSLQNQWLDISIDVSGGNNYVNLGTSKLNQVPYAMYAASAASIVGGTQIIADLDNDTKIQVEETVDDDVIRFDAGGTEIARFSKNSSGDLLFNTATSNVIVGQGAGAINTGDSNVFIGKEAARLNTTGRRNVVMGNQSGFGLTEGTLNVYVGTISGRDNATGNRNVAIGDSAGSGPDGGSSNVMLGTATGALSGGSNNIMIGDSAGANNASGTNNVMVGLASGLSSTGSGNVFLGAWTGASEAGDNKLHIDNSNTTTPLIHGDFATNQATINGTLTTTGIAYANGGIYFPGAFGPDTAYVGGTGNSISFAHPGSSEDFLGYISNNFYFRDSPGGGDTSQPSVYAQGFPTYSSKRWKHDIQDMDGAINVIKKLRGVTYTWNKDHGGFNDFGFVAEEVHEVLPQIAKKNAEGEIDGVEYGKVTPYLVEAFKEQQEVIESLQKEVRALKDQNKLITKLIEEIKVLKE